MARRPLAGTVAAAFGHEPCVDEVQRAAGQAVISVALDRADQRCAAPFRLHGSAVAPATDDRPFLYFRGGFLPSLYLLALAAILLVSLVAVRLVAGPFRAMRPYVDLFFMGAAFLLLETKSITTFALLFGTTWIVNAIVFAGVLVAVLLAVETTRRFRTPRLPILYVGIAGSLALAYVDPQRLAPLAVSASAPRRVDRARLRPDLPREPRVREAIRRQRRTLRAPSAINILGAMVGGCLEYVALLVGFRNLLIVAGLLYLAAFALVPRRGTRPA